MKILSQELYLLLWKSVEQIWDQQKDLGKGLIGNPLLAKSHALTLHLCVTVCFFPISLLQDLSSPNQYDTGVALTGLSCFVTPDLARDLANDIMTLVRLFMYIIQIVMFKEALKNTVH